MDMQKIGRFLAELRKEKNLTQEELGEGIKQFHGGKTGIICRPWKCFKF